jgi:hypothetical protein
LWDVGIGSSDILLFGGGFGAKRVLDRDVGGESRIRLRCVAEATKFYGVHV